MHKNDEFFSRNNAEMNIIQIQNEIISKNNNSFELTKSLDYMRLDNYNLNHQQYSYNEKI